MERRSALLAGDYRGQLAALDYMYHGTAVWEVGLSVETVCDVGQLQGLVIGAYLEGSKEWYANIRARCVSSRGDFVI